MKAQATMSCYSRCCFGQLVVADERTGRHSPCRDIYIVWSKLGLSQECSRGFDYRWLSCFSPALVLTPVAWTLSSCSM